MNYHQKKEIIAASITRLKNLQKQLDDLVIHCEWAKRTLPEVYFDYKKHTRGAVMNKMKNIINQMNIIIKLIEGL